MTQPSKFLPQFEKYQRLALIIGVVGLLISAIGLFTNNDQFLQSYLVSYVFWMQLSVGCAFVLAIQYLVSGRWGVVIQRILEAGGFTLPLMLILIVPVLLGLPTLYEWARPEAVAHDALLQHKAPYLNVPFFTFRVLGYLVIWSAIAYLQRKWSYRRDTLRTEESHIRLKNFSGPISVVLGLTVTFASFDLMMSLDAQWYSTIFGIIFGVGAGAAAFAFATIILALVREDHVFSGKLTSLQFNDLGNFLLTMVMLWAYMELSQFLIIWLGNLKEEIPWYLLRTSGGWGGMGIILVAFNFVVPFFFLLLRENKRRYGRVAAIAWIIIVARYIELYWFIAPTFSPTLTFHWLDLTLLVGIGGIWMSLFLWQLKQKPLLPEYDPRMEEESSYEHAATAEAV